MTRDVYIVEAVRTPFAKGREGGALSEVHPVDLLVTVLQGVVQRAGIDKSLVQDVLCGIVTPMGPQGANMPRLAVLKAGFPVTTGAAQLDRMCGSSLSALNLGAAVIASGDMNCVIACGVESMSKVPMGANSGLLKNGKIDGGCSFPGYKLLHQGVSAEMIADKYKISRRECDELAARSHERAANATAKGYFKNHIVPVETPSGKVVSVDEGIRHPSTPEQLGKLKTVFKAEGGVVTAGNASQISDGASAVLLMSGELVEALGLRKRARIVSRTTVGSDPEIMLTGIIPAVKTAIERAKISVADVDVLEANEAFATVVLALQREIKMDWAKVNPNGGAIAIGHPLGASGTGLVAKALSELERTGKRYACCALCIGFGQGVACVIENVQATSCCSKM
jgi:acetyl-CoA acetyltransferase family protein